MRNQGISAKRRRYRVKTTDSEQTTSIVPNLLQRNFSVDAANKIWVTDMTSISTQEGWFYLSTVVDVYSRRVVGWAMGNERNDDLVIAA